MSGESTSLMQVVPLVVLMVGMMVLFWWTIIRPTKARQKSHADLVAALKEGETVITAGGIYGKITKVRDKWLELEVANGVRVKFDRRAIRRLAGDDE